MLPTETPRSFRGEGRGRSNKIPGSSRNFENRHGSPALLQHQAAPVEAPRPSRRPGTSYFTDPRNPANRWPSKRMVQKETAYDESDRAGARTRNPRVIHSTRSEAIQSSRDSRGSGTGFVELRYSQGSDWRPSKRVANSVACGGSPTPRSSEGIASCWVAETMPGSAGVTGRGVEKVAKASVLENYLNDMKHVACSRKQVSANPSDIYKKVNDRSLPPSERRGYRSASLKPRQREADPEAAGVPTGGSALSRSLSFRRLHGGDEEASYGFTRKREVSAPWTSRRTADFLYHPDPEGQSLPGTPRCPSARSVRSSRGDTEGAGFTATADRVQRSRSESKRGYERTKEDIFGYGGVSRPEGATPRRAA